MNKMNRRIFNFFLLVMFFGIASSVSATTYRLQRVTSVENGGKYVFEQAGYVMTNTISSKALQTTNVFKTTGLDLTNNDDKAYVWELSSTSGGFKIYKYNATGDKYLANSNNTEMSWGSSSSASVWNFSFQSDGTALIKCVSTSRYLGGTGTSLSAYKCYTEDNLLWLCPHSVVVYQLVEEKGTSPDLSFDNAFFRFLKGESYSVPDLETAEGFDCTITYSSSNTKVATVNASTGEVMIVGPGRTLITASSASTASFDAGEATYTLLVMGGDGSADKPYSVSDMNSGYLTKSFSDKYVSGYIVGYYTTDMFFKTVADNDDCVAIADYRDDVTSFDIALIQFKTGDPQTNYGLKSHPNELGKRVKAYGRMNILRYKACIDNVESLSFADRYPVTISNYKYATYRTTEKLNFTNTGVSAYTAAIDGNNVKLTKISDGIVDTGLGVVLYSDAARTYDIPVTAAPATVTNTGLLISDGTKATKDNNTYVLGKKNDVVGFYRWIGNGSLPAGRVYLNGGASAAARDYLEFAFDDEATGMRDAVHLDKVEIRTDVVYDLQGRRVAQPGKGLYIVNGKKIVIK